MLSIVLNMREQKIFKINGHTIQFGTTPGVGRDEAVFLLKTKSQTIIKHNADSYVLFVDLIKEHDSVKHEVVSLALKNGSFAKMYKMSREVIC